jgi:hypothetical protein
MDLSKLTDSELQARLDEAVRELHAASKAAEKAGTVPATDHPRYQLAEMLLKPIAEEHRRRHGETRGDLS